MREKLIGLLDDALLSVNWDSYDYPDTDSAAEILIANDVLPVVRCKDCKHYSFIAELDDAPSCTKLCGLHSKAHKPKPDDFCSYGERKDNG